MTRVFPTVSFANFESTRAVLSVPDPALYATMTVTFFDGVQANALDAMSNKARTSNKNFFMLNIPPE